MMHIDALNALDPQCERERWIKIAFAFKDAGGTLEEFLTWSERAENFDRVDATTTFNRAKVGVNGGVGAATLFKWAREAGWKPETGGNGADGPALAVAPVRTHKAAKVAPATNPRPVWEAAAPATREHDYLQKKRIGPHGTRVDPRGWLVVAYIDEKRELQTVQFIAPDGKKRFLKGAPARGSVAVIGDVKGAACVVVCEGFATCAAVCEATGFAGIVAGSRGAFPEAARIARAWSPSGAVVIAADRGDMKTPIAAARAHRCLLALPGTDADAEGFDFADWRLAGATDDEIRGAILDAVSPEDDSPPAPDPLAVNALLDAARDDHEHVAAVVIPYRRDGEGKSILNAANVALYLGSGELGDFAFDTFTGLALWDGMPVDDGRLVELMVKVQRTSPFPRASATMVADALAQITRARSFNSCVRWLDSIPVWDRTERIANFFADVCGLESTDYLRAASRYFWLSLVGRMVRPGCKADAALVLIGPQGIGKSRLARIVGQERFGEVSLAHIGERDWFIQLRGKVLVEFSELAGHSRAELEMIKAVMSRETDDYRAPYARMSSSVPRGNVFIGTTNERDFLIDPTGNRRWLPVECGKEAFALDVAEGMREQCFAEAYAIHTSNAAGAFWHVPGALEIQADHVARDPWLDLLDARLRNLAGDLPDRIENVSIYEALKVPAERQTGGGTGRRIASVMRALGFDPVRWRSGARVVRGFARCERFEPDTVTDEEENSHRRV